MHQTQHLDGIGICQCDCELCVPTLLAAVRLNATCICIDCDSYACGEHSTQPVST